MTERSKVRTDWNLEEKEGKDDGLRLEAKKMREKVCLLGNESVILFLWFLRVK